jgi:hypothetical protein
VRGEGGGEGEGEGGLGKGDKFYIYSRHVYLPSTVPGTYYRLFLFRFQAVSNETYGTTATMKFKETCHIFLLIFSK